MPSLPLLFLLSLHLPALSHGGAEPRVEGDRHGELRRRLEERARRLELREAQAEALDARGLLPPPEVAGLRLRQTFLVRRSDPWRPLRAAAPPGYRAAGGRRLASDGSPLAEVLQHSVNLNGPRGRVLGLALLNAAALPAETYNSTARWEDWGSLVYEDDKQAFAPNASNATQTSSLSNGTSSVAANSSLASGGGGGAGTNASLAKALERFRNDAEALIQGRETVREQVGRHWTSDSFLGQRNTSCADREASQEMCLDDVGVALSVYEDANYKVLVFHGGWGEQDRQYTMWLHKDWAIERFQEQVRLDWTIKAHQTLEQGMLDRGGTRADEKEMRCAFKETAFRVTPDIEALAQATSATAEDVEQLGLWSITKMLVRTVLPADRQHGSKQILLTGAGTGGVRAALVSMWLVQEDSAEYKTYVIAGHGWDCVARRLYTSDMTPWQTYTNIFSYSHIMDALANGLDRQPGQVCLYGRLSVTATSPERDYCSRFVGFTGAQLLHRGSPEPSAEIAAARAGFLACHYFTHSVWYAVLLLISEWVLFNDGTTDGGCTTQPPVPQEDRLQQCPDPEVARAFCQEEEPENPGVQLGLMLGVAGGILGALSLMGVIFYICLRQLRDDAWVFGKDAHGKETSLFFFLDWFRKKKKPLTDRARAARQRAHSQRRKAALKMRERHLRRQATDEEKKKMKAERAAKKAAKAQGAEDKEMPDVELGDNSAHFRDEAAPNSEEEPGIGLDEVGLLGVVEENPRLEDPLLAAAAEGCSAAPAPGPRTLGRTSLQAVLDEANNSPPKWAERPKDRLPESSASLGTAWGAPACARQSARKVANKAAAQMKQNSKEEESEEEAEEQPDENSNEDKATREKAKKEPKEKERREKDGKADKKEKKEKKEKDDKAERRVRKSMAL